MKKVFNLINGTDVMYKKNADTPRIALCFNMSMNNVPKKAGTATLMARLLMQGTKNRTSEQLAEELDSYAIEMSTEMKLDYLKLKFLCLNEDFDKSLEILEDIIKNSTFEEFEKEKLKLIGEIQAQMDSPRAKVVDNFYKTIYANHFYGNTNTVIMETLSFVTKEDVISCYNEFINDSKKVIAVVGDFDFDEVTEKLNARLGNLPVSKQFQPDKVPTPHKTEQKQVEIIKPDANQAHIIQGWLVGDDYPALSLLNIMLGASGLSSRLFLELREKKGLAYVVRSSYDLTKLCSNFSIYIATEPSNIEVSLAGFKEEIDKIKNVLVSEEELNNARNNLCGKWAFSQEDNNRQASLYAYYGVNDWGFDYNDRMREAIKSVTPEDIKACANKYFNDDYVVSVIKP